MWKKTSLVLVIVTLFFAVPLQAQEERGEKGEEILEQKLEFFKKNLKLDEDDWKDFRSAYLHYIKEKRNLRRRYRKEVLQKIRKGNLEKLSKEEQEKLIDIKLELDKSRYLLENGFQARLRKMLKPDKVLTYYKLEREFYRKMKKSSREEKQRTKSINIQRAKK